MIATFYDHIQPCNNDGKPGSPQKSVAGKLIKHIVEKAREDQQKFMPLCTFAKVEFDKHKEYQDVLHN
ncbi:GNAT family N-acetyltransferase [Jeotgalibacillus terrae]|uniref:GNAT family N-acetyltransferase n=1 Tax=Jeotgalibacillus terrae TaxID=587735 RepID=A0ABW5ZGX7_9BACL